MDGDSDCNRRQRYWRYRGIRIRELFIDGVQKKKILLLHVFFLLLSSSLLQRILQLVPLIICVENQRRWKLKNYL
jgi:hypothetical protein